MEHFWQGRRRRWRQGKKCGALAKMSNEVSAGQPQIWTGCHNICHCFARPRFIAFPHTHTHVQDDNNNSKKQNDSGECKCSELCTSCTSFISSFALILVLSSCNYASCRCRQPRAEFLSDFVFDKWLCVRYPAPRPLLFTVSTYLCVCVSLAFLCTYVCTFPLMLGQEAISPHCSQRQNSVYSAIYCATFVIIIAMQLPLPLSLSLPQHALPGLELEKSLREAPSVRMLETAATKMQAKKKQRSRGSRIAAAAAAAASGRRNCSWRRSRRRWQHTHNCK